jgi:polyhydroxybutyrate depolymerase
MHLAVLIALLLALTSIAAGCRRGGSGVTNASKTAHASSASTASATTPVAPNAAATATCETPLPHAAGDASATLRSGGLDRAYLLHVPPSYDGTRRMPLVLTLHGFGSNGRQQAVYSGFPAKGDREGFIVVSPDGTGTPLHWTYPGLGDVDDIAFIRELLDRLEGTLCIDAKQVFISGMSNGAAFAQRVACAMPERIAAVAAVTALVYPRDCDTDAPVAVIGFQGTDDPCVPFGGGTSQCGQRLPVPPIEESAKNWALHDGCGIGPTEQRFSEHVRTITYSGCRGETAVVLFVIEGGGHTWPGSIDVARLGATTREVNATDQIWQFFAAQAAARP